MNEVDFGVFSDQAKLCDALGCIVLTYRAGHVVVRRSATKF